MKKILLSILLLSLLGCQSKEEKRADDRHSFENPEKVGTLPNGQQVSRVTLKDTPNDRTHYIYFTDNAVSNNSTYTTSSGKTTTTHDTVYVNIAGKDIDVEKLRDIVRKADEDRNGQKLDAIESEIR